MRPQPICDISDFDFDNPLYGIDEIREFNPQRDEMEQLTGVVHIDEENGIAVGFKDVTDQEFWISGHMPDYPLMPGVIQCEAAAQLAGFYARKYDIIGGDYLGFGGLEDVRFRLPIFPNYRLILMAKVERVRRNRRGEFAFQGYLGDQLAFNGTMIGVPIQRERNS